MFGHLLNWAWEKKCANEVPAINKGPRCSSTTSSTDLMSHDLMHHVDVEDFKKQFLQLNNRNYGYGSTPVESCDPATQEVVKGNKQIGGRPATTKSQHPSTYCSSSLPLPSSPHSDKQLDVPGRCLLIDQIRAQDLKRLHGQAYLDYGGAGFYSERQLDEAMADLRTQLLMNPHSSSSEVTHGGGALDNDVNELRHLTLEMLNAPAGEYAVVLTGGATAALKMVGECFPWSTRSTFTYTLHNHNSVLGIREYALAAESQVYVIDLEQQQQQTEHNPTQQKSVSQQLGPYRINHIQTLRAPGSCCQTSTKKCGNSGTRPFSGSHTFMPPGRGGDDKQACRSNDAAAPLHLFAMPSECNFSGVKYDLSVADAARKNGLEGLHMALHAAPSAGCRTCSSISSSSICVCVPTAPDPASDVVSSSSAEVTSPSGEAASEGSAAAAAAASSDRSNRAEGRCLVLLDASKGCATSPPDLSAHPVDFLVLSYYKIFGYPTGLGALVVRKDALRLLRQPYFAGGTVLAVSADGYDVHRRGGAACWEYGTLPFTAISAACHGFAFIRHLGGFSAISRHSGCLAEYLAQKLMDLRHENGTTVVEMYGAWVPAGTAALADGGSSSSGAGGVQHVQVREATDLPRGTQGANIYDDWKQGAGAGGLKAAGSRAMNQQPLLGMLTGPTVTFNLLQPDGTYVGYGEVQTVAKLHGIHLRVGCFCNPGACAKMLGLSSQEIKENFEAGHVCWDERDLGVGGKPTGAIRASLGSLSTIEEVQLLLRLISHYFVSSSHQDTDPPTLSKTGQAGNASRRPASAVAAAASAAASSAVPVEAAPCDGTANNDTRLWSGAAQSSSEEATGSSSSSSTALHEAPPLISQICGATLSDNPTVHTGMLTHMYIYPVKSCAPMQVPAWPVGPTGLLLDREWALLDDSSSGSGGSNGTVLTQKACPKMASVVPRLDLRAGTLTLHAPGCMESLAIQLSGTISVFKQSFTSNDLSRSEIKGGENTTFNLADGGNVDEDTLNQDDQRRTSSAQHLAGSFSLLERKRFSDEGMLGGNLMRDEKLLEQGIRVCGDLVCGWVVGEGGSQDGDQSTRIREWFRRAIGVPCRLVRQADGMRKTKRGYEDVQHDKKKKAQGQQGISVAALRDSSRKLSSHVGHGSPLMHVGETIPGDDIWDDNHRSPLGGSTGALGASRNADYINRTAEQSTSSLGGLGLLKKADFESSPQQNLGPQNVVQQQGDAAGSGSSSLGFANDGQYLLINAASLVDLNARLATSGRESKPLNERRFRPNLVVDGFEAYEEDQWIDVKVGSAGLEVLGTCPRCDMLSVDQESGLRGKPGVLLELAQYRRLGGKMHFGVLLATSAAVPAANTTAVLSFVGDALTPSVSQAALPAAAAAGTAAVAGDSAYSSPETATDATATSRSTTVKVQGNQAEAYEELPSSSGGQGKNVADDASDGSKFSHQHCYASGSAAIKQDSYMVTEDQQATRSINTTACDSSDNDSRWLSDHFKCVIRVGDNVSARLSTAR